MMKAFLLSLTLFCFTANGASQSMTSGAVQNDTVPTINLFPVTVIALKQKATSFTKNYAVEPIQRLEHDGANLLNRLPEFSSIKKSGSYGFDPVFRGFKYDQLTVTIDGSLGATAACPNRMDPPTSQVSPNMIDRVEVYKGPFSLRYGNTFGATLNFVMKEPEFSPSLRVNGRLGSSYETNGQIVRSEMRMSLLSKSASTDFFFSRSQGDDYSDAQGSLVQADFERSSFGLNSQIQLKPNQLLGVSFTYNEAQDVSFPAQAMDLIFDRTALFKAKHTLKGNGTSSFNRLTTEVFGSFVDHKMSNQLRTLTPRMLDAVATAQTQNSGSRVEGHWQSDSYQLFVGGDYRVESVDGTRERSFLMGPNAGKTFEDNLWQESQIARTSLFAEYTLKKGLWQKLLSARLERNVARADALDPLYINANGGEQPANQWNPSLSLGLSRSMNSTSTVGFWLGRAQRSGNLSERFINFLPIGLDPYEIAGNPTLKPEVNYEADITYDYKTPSLVMNIDVFASRLANYITSEIDPTLTSRLPNAPGVRRVVNNDAAFKTGVEFALDQALSEVFTQNLSFAYTYAHDLDTKSPLPEIAPLDLRYKISGAFEDQKLRSSLDLRWAAAQKRVASFFGETETPSFFLVNANLNYTLFEGLELQLTGSNLLDSHYYEHLTRSVSAAVTPIYAPGRSVQLGAVWEF